MAMSHRIHVIDSHTAGEPTRVVVSGGPELGAGTVAEQLERFRERFDRFRSAIVCEPRGSDVVVGALLTTPAHPTCSAGVIFFNNVGYLGMCGHGTIGLVATLAHLGRIEPGVHRIETSVGIVTATLHPDQTISVENVPSWRLAKDVPVAVPGLGAIAGDVAWGGNWFFLTEAHRQALELNGVETLVDVARRIRLAVNAQGFPQVDHVELLGPPLGAAAHSRNFVLCPGNAYDRSPCGTGTSAKLACLAADGKLREGDIWVQEGILGTCFRGSWHARRNRESAAPAPGQSAAPPRIPAGTVEIIPTITGSAQVTAETTLLLDETDPFCWGIR